MVLPLGDVEKTRIVPIATYVLIALNVAMYLVELGPRRGAVVAQVGEDDVEARRQGVRDPDPVAAGAQEAVQADDRRALPLAALREPERRQRLLSRLGVRGRGALLHRLVLPLVDVVAG